MIVQKLHGGWKMKKSGDTALLPAKVPGSVYNDLLINKKMEDPFWRDNEDSALALMENDFEYENTFAASPKLLKNDGVLLRCHGLDTLADLYLNGALLGKADNMHRIWEFDVKDRLKDGENSLRIVFHSPTKFIREAYKKIKTDGTTDAMEGFPQIRKAHCMFGWDWGPHLPDAGIWRDIELVGFSIARIDSVYVTQKHKKDSVDLNLAVKLDQLAGSLKAPVYSVTVTDPKGKLTQYDNSPKKITIDNPELWWPNGFGAQPLYTIRVTISNNGKELDSWERRIGLRTMTMHIQKDKWGEGFSHRVNGVDIFAMGADYIPEDNILSRVNPDRTRKLLEQCTAANFNVLRVWGGGYYPDDFFYDICDELGLMVWQDFMFACAVYELTDEFDRNIRAEVADNVKRLRHHASLGLWCGNNEMEMFVDTNTWVSSPKQKADYIKMYEYIIPQVLKEHDSETFYWPASPSSGGSFDEPNGPNRGDVHYWDVWHGNKPFSDYRNYYFRYVSEFGFQSFPSLKTVESFTLPEDRNVFSYVMEKHQRNNAANGKIMNYLYQTFLYPTSFDTLLYTSQLLQAEAIKYGVEHFRRHRGRCMGAIYWQLNDCWPVASWASIDYHFRWKALHYYAKRFFQPLMVSCHEEGILTQNPNLNLTDRTIEKSFRLSVANETMEAKKLSVKWEIRDKTARVLKEKTIPVKVDALSSAWLDKVDVPDIALDDEYLSYHLYDGDTLVSEGTVIFSLPKFFHYEDPKLSYTIKGDIITVKAAAYAKSVEIRNRNEDLVLSDNYFDMNAGEKKVKILSGKSNGIKLRSVFDIR
ncbi:beta-mannosidase [Treponema primitia]|uniref:beta-mannosidase n=1 Tax=Treponema primitia TaxID=88058 RepID=UPI000255503B|nr:glycoside hydrolase family 2 protein [Treponema primitia]